MLIARSARVLGPEGVTIRGKLLSSMRTSGMAHRRNGVRFIHPITAAREVRKAASGSRLVRVKRQPS